jgi:hypothetical protein
MSKGHGYQSWNKKVDEMLIEILEEVLKEKNGKIINGKVKWDSYSKVIDIYNNKIGVRLIRKNVDNRLKT